MKQFWDVILDALIDTAKILPLLFIVYYLIELFEYKCAKKLQQNKMLKGKLSPVFASMVGCVPQCGFSVISSDLFSKKAISIGALIAVFIATSDEAIPLLISNPKLLPYLLLLIAIKFVYAIIIGYASMGLYKLFFKKTKSEELKGQVHVHDSKGDKENLILESEKTDDSVQEIEHGGCCHHHVETKTFDWVHPLLHCLKICLIVLVVNILFGVITEIWIGTDNLMLFLNKSKYIQPLFAILVGLIPNCASSLVLTEMFMSGMLGLSSLVAGLCVNAGLGLIVLFKQNKNIQENIFVISILIIASIIIGYALIWI